MCMWMTVIAPMRNLRLVVLQRTREILWHRDRGKFGETAKAEGDKSTAARTSERIWGRNRAIVNKRRLEGFPSFATCSRRIQIYSCSQSYVTIAGQG